MMPCLSKTFTLEELQVGTFLYVAHTFPFRILCLFQVIKIVCADVVLNFLAELAAISDGMFLHWHCSRLD